MTKTIFMTLGMICSLLLFLTSCSKEAVLESDVIVEAEAPVSTDEKISLYVAETGDYITVNSMDEIKDLIQTKYSHLDYAEASIERLDAYEEELAYSETLDLEDPEVAQKYALDLSQRYGVTGSETAATRGTGILFDGQGTGFLSVTTVPLNLRSSKRNRASSWTAIAGVTVLCDRTWWRGTKVVVLGIASLVDLRPLGFDNRTDSFF